MAALDDTPRWALIADASLVATLGRMTRLKFETIADPSESNRSNGKRDSAESESLWNGQRALHAVQNLLAPQRAVLHPRGSHPLLDGVHSVLAISEFPASHWRASTMDAAALLEIAQRSPTPPVRGALNASAVSSDDSADQTTVEPALWLKRQGKGQILVSGFASIFSNKLIGEQDNARLLSNVIAWSRDPRGVVIFDDAHQGAVAYYDAKAFFADPRLHRTLLWVVLLWLLFVLGWQRMRPSEERWNPIDATAFIRVTGEFFADALSPGAAGARLFGNFFNAIRQRLSLRDDGTPLWEWLASDARINPSQLAELQRLYARTQAGKRVDLVRLHNLLSRLMGTLE
jgi:hypothetical protein